MLINMSVLYMYIEGNPAMAWYFKEITHLQSFHIVIFIIRKEFNM